MSWTKKVLEYTYLGMTEAEATAIVRAEREAADVGNGSIEGGAWLRRGEGYPLAGVNHGDDISQPSDLDSQLSTRIANRVLEHIANAEHSLAPDCADVEAIESVA